MRVINISKNVKGYMNIQRKTRTIVVHNIKELVPCYVYKLFFLYCGLLSGHHLSASVSTYIGGAVTQVRPEAVQCLGIGKSLFRYLFKWFSN